MRYFKNNAPHCAAHFILRNACIVSLRFRQRVARCDDTCLRACSGRAARGDSNGNPFDGNHNYQIKFGPNDLPPVRAFWSITLYDASMLLYANSINRHVINSPMVKNLLRDADGGFTLYVQHESPGGEQEKNWLPVPQGKFTLTFRCYQPEEAIRNFTYRAPPVVMVA